MATRMSVRRAFSRQYSTDYSWHPFAHHGNTEKTMKMWKNLTLFVALPTCGIGMINTYLKTQEEEKTLVRPEYKPYDHMYIRNKRFPWGDGNHTFFHNPRRNAIPGVGYELPQHDH